MASPAVMAAGEALIDILRDPHHGPAGKTGLSGLIALQTGRPCPPWLFDLAVKYARHESNRRNDSGWGSVFYSGPMLDVYGYAGDIETATQLGLLYRGAHTRTRARHEAEMARNSTMNFVGNPQLHRLLAQQELISDTYASHMDNLIAQAELVAGVTAVKTLRRLGVNNEIKIAL